MSPIKILLWFNAELRPYWIHPDVFEMSVPVQDVEKQLHPSFMTEKRLPVRSLKTDEVAMTNLSKRLSTWSQTSSLRG